MRDGLWRGPQSEATAAVQAGVTGWAGTLALGGGAHLEGVLEIEMTTTVKGVKRKNLPAIGY